MLFFILLYCIWTQTFIVLQIFKTQKKPNAIKIYNEKTPRQYLHGVNKKKCEKSCLLWSLSSVGGARPKKSYWFCFAGSFE